MGIFQYPQRLAGQDGVIGAIKYMTTTDSLSTITTAGYLNNIDLAVFPVSPNDVLGVTYGFNLQTRTGTFELFTVSISNGVITLVQWTNPGDVLLPVVSGNVASFNGTTGQIRDSGVAVSSLSTAVTQLGTLNQVSVTLNQAAVQGMFAAPFQIVAAPGAGLVAVPVYMTLYTNFQTTAFAGGGVGILQWGNTVHGAGTESLAATIPAAEITATASQLYSLAGSTASVITGTTNAGLFLSNQTAAFTGGSASSTVVVNLVYMTVTGTV